jgi:hypothetical protein
MGALALLSVVLAPIAWVHSFVLLFPAWLAVLTSGPHASLPPPRLALVALGIGTSGLLTIGPRALRALVLEHSVYGWSAILLWLILVLALRARPVTPNPVSG